MLNQKLNKRYKVTDSIGQGAMGVVYRATDTLTRTEVALKVITNQLSLDPATLERFKREGEALRQLKHPNIVGFIDTFSHQDNYVIAMEYISGGSLYELIKQDPLSLSQTWQIGLDLCDALIRAHRLNIVHRDIKPENILIDQDGTPKLADFGVAHIGLGTRMTRTGTQVGTPYYMAPEAWEGKTLDAQADIWSLGVVLFEMLSGEVPFGGTTGAVVMTKVLTTEPPNLNDLRADVPPEFVQIIRRMLTRDKEQRYKTMREVAVDLERLQLPVEDIQVHTSTRIIEEQVEDKIVVPPTPAPKTKTNKSVTSSKPNKLIFGGLLLAGIITIGILLASKFWIVLPEGEATQSPIAFTESVTPETGVVASVIHPGIFAAEAVKITNTTLVSININELSIFKNDNLLYIIRDRTLISGNSIFVYTRPGASQHFYMNLPKSAWGTGDELIVLIRDSQGITTQINYQVP